MILSSTTADFVDPGFVYDALLAKTIGRLVLRVVETQRPLFSARATSPTRSPD